MKQRMRALLLLACAAQLLAGAVIAQTPPAPAAAPATQAQAAAAIEPRVNTSAPAARAPVKSAARSAGARTNADRIDLDTTQITGNRELPKVLYIVPWKRPELGDLVGRPLNSLLDELLTPVDRDVFRRENRYFNALQAGGEKPAPAPVPATPAPGSGAASPGTATVPGSTSQPVPVPKPES